MSRIDALFRRIASEEDALRARDRLTERLVARLEVARPLAKRSPRRWVIPLVAAATVIWALGLSFVRWNRSTPLAVEIGESGAAPLVGAWLGAPEKKSLPLRFSDGSRFDLAPGSKARLVELRRGGARLELASGSVKVHVVPRPAADFRLDAGPFGVRVTGTRFELGYRPDEDVFELYLEEGQVELTGCVFGQGRKLAAGQSVRASCAKQALDVTYGRPGRGPEAANGERRPNASDAPRAPSPGPTSKGTPLEEASDRHAAAAAPASGVAPDWLALARKGAYTEAFSAVREKGFDAECERADSQTLALLSDVARHAGAKRQAEQALVTLRRRFPGTGDAALAAFALGRLEFDEFQAYPRAAAWFRTYLNERPSGPMTREALGRLIEACYRARDLEGARAAAARYLRDYPSGPHAELASRVAASP